MVTAGQTRSNHYEAVALSETTKRAALLLALLFVAAMVAGYVALAAYTALTGGALPSLRFVGGGIAVFSLLLLIGVRIYRRF
ncbi:MAG: hypothetical protein V5A38_01795 [Halolamina sp.]|uniref:hypothetical protein n=1 Tax=Halolamina sp. TaxID=1940283 RepID=UPI002FC2D638